MVRRMNLRKKYIIFDKNKKRSKKNLILLIIFLLIIIVFLSLYMMNRVLSPFLESYAKAEMKKISNLILNQSLSKEVRADMNVDNLYVLHKDSSGAITSVDLNSAIVNELLGEVTKKVSQDFKLVEQGKVNQLTYYQDVFDDTMLDKKALKKGVVFYIPTGLAFKNVFLSNLGPKIPVRFRLTGEIRSNLQTKITNYGINNALLEVNMHVEITQMLLLPFSTSSIKVEGNYPLIVKLIEGIVPDTYFSGIHKNSETVFRQVS